MFQGHFHVPTAKETPWALKHHFPRGGGGGLSGSGYMEAALKHYFPLLLIYELKNVGPMW